MDVSGTMLVVTAYAIVIGCKISGAIIFWLIGRRLISPAVVRPYRHTDHYWQVYFDTDKMIRETFGAAGFPVAEQHFVLRNP